MDSNKTTAAALFKPVFLVSTAFTFLMFGLPIFSKALGASAFEIGGLFSVFTVTILVLRPIVGWALDRLGRKPFFLAATFTYALCMFLFATADSLGSLYLARLAQGIASALMWITVHTIVADLTPAIERGHMMGRVNEMDVRGELVGAIAGFTLMGFLGPERGWPLAFLGYALAAAAGGVVAWRQVPETRPERLSHEEARQGISPVLWRLLGAVFITTAASALISPVYLIYLQDKFTTQIETLAWAFFPAGVLMAFLPSRMGRLSDRIGRAPLMAAGLALSGVLTLALPVLPALGWLVVVYTLTSVGWAMSGPAESAMVADLTGAQMRGRGYGFYELASGLGASVGPLLGGWLYDTAGKSIPFFANGILLLAGAVWVVLALRERRQG